MPGCGCPALLTPYPAPSAQQLPGAQGGFGLEALAVLSSSLELQHLPENKVNQVKQSCAAPGTGVGSFRALSTSPLHYLQLRVTPVPLVSAHSGLCTTLLQDYFRSPLVQTSGFQPLRMPGDLRAVPNGSAMGSHKSCKRVKLFTAGLGLLDRGYMGRAWGF